MRENLNETTNMNRDAYDGAAEEFSASRDVFWPELAYLAEHAVSGDRVLDLGCGNGRLYPLIASRGAKYMGVDNSTGLLTIARRRSPDAEFAEEDARKLSFPDRSFERIFSFAVLHHMKGKAAQEEMLREAARVIVPGGTFILSVWYLWDIRHLRVMLVGILRSLFPGGSGGWGDITLTLGKGKYPRFIHAFRRKELRNILERTGFAVVGEELARRPSGEKNLVVVARRVARA